MTITGLCACTYGYMFGTLIQDPLIAVMVGQFGTVLIYYGGGPFFNLREHDQDDSYNQVILTL